MRDEMVVIGEDRPGFKLPTEIARNGEQAPVQHAQPIRAAKVMLLVIGAGGEEVGSAVRETMQRSVGPWDLSGMGCSGDAFTARHNELNIGDIERCAFAILVTVSKAKGGGDFLCAVRRLFRIERLSHAWRRFGLREQMNAAQKLLLELSSS